MWNSTAISSATGSWDSSKVRVHPCRECCGIRRCQQCRTACSALGAPGEARAAPQTVQPKRRSWRCCQQPDRVPVAICSGEKPSRGAESGEREPIGRWLLFRCRAAIERGKFGFKEQTDSRCRCPPETEGESAQQPEAGPPPGPNAAGPRASQGRGWAAPAHKACRFQCPPRAKEREPERRGCMAHPRYGPRVRTSGGRTRYGSSWAGRETEGGERTV